MKTFLEMRKRLGWNQEDLVRRLGCSIEEVKAWEENRAQPPKHLQFQMEMFWAQAEEISLEMKGFPLADQKIQDELLEQLDSEDLDLSSEVDG